MTTSSKLPLNVVVKWPELCQRMVAQSNHIEILTQLPKVEAAVPRRTQASDDARTSVNRMIADLALAVLGQGDAVSAISEARIYWTRWGACAPGIGKLSLQQGIFSEELNSISHPVDGAVALTLGYLSRSAIGLVKSEIAIPVLFETGQRGGMATLTLRELSQGPPGLWPDPAVMLPFISDENFREGVRNAAKVAGLTSQCVLWDLKSDGQPLIEAQGGSLGAAFAAGLVQLRRRWLRLDILSRYLRSRTAISATIDQYGRLHAVGGLELKLKDAAKSSLNRVVVSSEQTRTPDQIRRYGLKLVTADTVDEVGRHLRRVPRSLRIAMPLLLALVMLVGFAIHRQTQAENAERSELARQLLSQMDADSSGAKWNLAEKSRYQLAAYSLARSAGNDSLANQILQHTLTIKGELYQIETNATGPINLLQASGSDVLAGTETGELYSLDASTGESRGRIQEDPGTDSPLQPTVHLIVRSPNGLLALAFFQSEVSNTLTVDQVSLTSVIRRIGRTTATMRGTANDAALVAGTYTEDADVVTAGHDGAIRHWNVAQDQPSPRQWCSLAKGEVPSDIAWDGKGHRVLVSLRSGEILALADAMTGAGTPCRTEQLRPAANALDARILDATRLEVVTLLSNGNLRVARTGSPARIIQLPFSGAASLGTFGRDSSVVEAKRGSNYSATQVDLRHFKAGPPVHVQSDVVSQIDSPLAGSGQRLIATVDQTQRAVSVVNDTNQGFLSGAVRYTPSAQLLISSQNAYATVQLGVAGYPGPDRIQVIRTDSRSLVRTAILPSRMRIGLNGHGVLDEVAVDDDGTQVAAITVDRLSHRTRLLLVDLMAGVDWDLTPAMTDIPEGQSPVAVRFISGTDSLAVATSDGRVLRYDLHGHDPGSGRVLYSSGHSDSAIWGLVERSGVLTFLDASRSGDQDAERVVNLPVGGGGAVTVWDIHSLGLGLRQGRMVKVASLQPDTAVLATGDGTIFRLDAHGKLGVHATTGISDVMSLFPVADDGILVGGMSGRVILDQGDLSLLPGTQFSGSELFAVPLHNGDWTVEGGLDGTSLRLIGASSLLDSLCGDAQREFTPGEWRSISPALSRPKNYCSDFWTREAAMKLLTDRAKHAEAPSLVRQPTDIEVDDLKQFCDERKAGNGLSDGAEGELSWSVGRADGLANIDGSDIGAVICKNGQPQWVSEVSGTELRRLSIEAGRLVDGTELAIVSLTSESPGESPDQAPVDLLASGLAWGTFHGRASLTRDGFQLTFDGVNLEFDYQPSSPDLQWRPVLATPSGGSAEESASAVGSVE